MGWYITEGFLIAIIACFVSRNIAALISAAVIVPLIFWFVVAAIQINSNPSSAQQIADSTISQMVTYIGNHLPGIVISDVFGTITGAFIGLFAFEGEA